MAEQKRTRKVLITGANGFLGSQLVNFAAQNGYEVVAMVRDSANTSLISSNGCVEIVKTDDDYLAQLKTILLNQKLEIIIHCAALTAAHSIDDYERVNVMLTHRIIEILEGLKFPGQFVFMSSLAAIGPSTNTPITSKTDYHPITPYGQSKQKAEKRLMDSPINYLILRPTAVFGPGDKDFLQLFRSIQMRFEMPLRVPGQKISLIYVDDLVKIVFGLCKNVNRRSIYNISDGNTYSPSYFSHIVSEKLNRKSLKLPMPPWLAMLGGYVLSGLSKLFKFKNLLNPHKINELSKNWEVDIEELAEDSGIHQFTPIAKGIEETIDFYKKQNWLSR